MKTVAWIASALGLANIAVAAVAPVFVGCYAPGILDNLVPGLLSGVANTLVWSSAATCASGCGTLGHPYSFYNPGITLLGITLLPSCYCAPETALGPTGMSEDKIVRAQNAAGSACQNPVLSLGLILPIYQVQRSQYNVATPQQVTLQGCYSTTGLTGGAAATTVNNPDTCFTTCTNWKYMSITPIGTGGSYSCQCGTTQALGASTICNANVAVAYMNAGGTASLAARRRRAFEIAMKAREREKVCPGTMTPCFVGTPSLQNGAPFECIDTTSELESCGGCLRGEYSAAFSIGSDIVSSGQDCTALPGVALGAVSCARGRAASALDTTTSPSVLPKVDRYAPLTKPSVAPSPVVPPQPQLPLLRPPRATAPAPPPAGYTRTLHAAPAAWPKQLRESVGTCARDSTPFGAVPPQESKEARARRIDAEKDAIITRRHAAVEWRLDEARAGGQPAQWLASERWRRDVQVPGGVTLVFAHANGLQKELWHPMARRMLAQQATPGALFGSGAPLRKDLPVVVNDLWFIDDPHHGASQDLNAGKLAPLYAWIDWGRDMLNFVQHVLPSYNTTADAPWQLEWNEKGAAPPAPNVIGVGHSYGGNGLVYASVTAPDAFSSLFLIEPMNQPLLRPTKLPITVNPIVLGALKRRSEWPSIKDAAAMKSNPMFGTWDDEVFQLFLSHGLVPTDPARPDGEVTLATPRWTEATIFADPFGPQRGWDRLLELSVPAGFLMAGNANWMGGPAVAQEIAWRAPRARNERIMHAGHLLVQETPTEAADALWRFLTTLAAGDWDTQESKL